VGFGGDATVLMGNLDILYRADFPGSAWALIFGAGPVIAHVRESNDCPDGFDCNFSDTEGGFTAVVGVKRGPLSIELRSSDRGRSFAALAGFTFGR
jgi:hypothetical protein